MSKKSTSSSKKKEPQEPQEQANPQPETVMAGKEKNPSTTQSNGSIYLLYEEIFWIVKVGPDEYLHKGFNAPVAPFSRGGNPVSAEVWTLQSTETQQVTINTINTVIDSNGLALPLVVGGRPKSRRR